MANEALIMRVRAALEGVGDPATGRNILASGRIQGLSASPSGVVRFALEAGGYSESEANALLEKARAAAAGAEGVARVAAVATSHQGRSGAPGGHSNALGLKKERVAEMAESLPGVRNIIAVASGKGGVGKSTVAANLAVALARRGHTIGLLDADIYGPSLPTLFGLHEKPRIKDSKIVPAEAFGVKAMSIGLIVDAEKALAWRGPMVMTAVRQLMSDVAWGALDALIIDTPPGTGDAQLTLGQSKKLTGAIIISTPQELALADVKRGVELFRQLDVPILGVIENMAWLETESGNRQYLFGKGGAERAARQYDAPFLGALPIFPDLREACDEGAPLVWTAPDSAAGKAFALLAAKVEASFIP
ncbi:MAG TPA: Mrp/NBP35 family ATP-binding protein [Parvularculaceae bacterium]|nr:Mrp/NBP35 family ATP-binding protein [Parvularculaceae bacterium]